MQSAIKARLTPARAPLCYPASLQSDNRDDIGIHEEERRRVSEIQRKGELLHYNHDLQRSKLNISGKRLGRLEGKESCMIQQREENK